MKHFSQRLAGWVCVLTHALSLAAPAASSASLFTPLNTVCVDEVAAGGVTPRPEATVRYTFDRLGRKIGEESRGVEHSFVYDLGGNLTTASYGSGRQVVTVHDALNRPTTMTETQVGSAALPRVTSYGYDKAGKAITLTSANGQVTVNAYDAAGRLIKRELFRESGGFKQTVFDWTHDANGNVTSQTETWPGTLARTAGTRTTSMVYDWASRLLTETIVDPQEGTTTTLYAYNAANNRTSKQVIGGMLYTLRDIAGTGAHDALLV